MYNIKQLCFKADIFTNGTPYIINLSVGNYTMTDFEISKLIQKEFKEMTLGVTSQYLEIHEPIYEKTSNLK
jgi:hypothetical protein